MNAMSVSNELLARQLARYAVKSFDKNKKISNEVWQVLEEVLRLTPSSYNLQPWKFVVVTNPTLKKVLREYSYGSQAQIEDCSHYVVLCARIKIEETHLDRHIQNMSSTLGLSLDAFTKYRQVVENDIYGLRKDIMQTVNSFQVYIALGNFLASAALLGIDTCPIEGFQAPLYDEVLDLEDEGFKSIVSCAAGYRDPSDKYADLPKVRFPKESIFEWRK